LTLINFYDIIHGAARVSVRERVAPSVAMYTVP